MGGVEMWRGGLGVAYLSPALSLAGASLATPCCRFHTLIEPDVRNFSALFVLTLIHLFSAIQAALICGWEPHLQSIAHQECTKIRCTDSGLGRRRDWTRI
jgi:hypothetical protein